MKTKHTPGPWRIAAAVVICAADHAGNSAQVATTRYSAFTWEEEERNAQRIVKCVNALEGFNDPSIIREQIRVMRAALAEIASIPKHGEPEEDGSPHAQDWDDNGGYYAIKALHNAIDKARAVIDATKEG